MKKHENQHNHQVLDFHGRVRSNKKDPTAKTASIRESTREDSWEGWDTGTGGTPTDEPSSARTSPWSETSLEDKPVVNFDFFGIYRIEF